MDVSKESKAPTLRLKIMNNKYITRHAIHIEIDCYKFKIQLTNDVYTNSGSGITDRLFSRCT